MARTFVEEFGRLLKETKDMEVFRLAAIVLRRTQNGRVSSGWKRNMEFAP